jgi:hypothetical protein
MLRSFSSNCLRLASVSSRRPHHRGLVLASIPPWQKFLSSRTWRWLSISASASGRTSSIYSTRGRCWTRKALEKAGLLDLRTPRTGVRRFNRPSLISSRRITGVGAVGKRRSSIALPFADCSLSWGRWQANPSEDPLGPGGPNLAEILWTHWVRTLIENAYAPVLFGWMVQVL